MRSTYTTFLVALTFPFLGTTAAGQTPTVDSTIEKVLNVDAADLPGPGGPLDEVYIGVHGTLANTCYRFSRAQVDDLDLLIHEIRIYAEVTTYTRCLMVTRPFDATVSLGHLPPGTHVLRFLNGNHSYFERQLIVN